MLKPLLRYGRIFREGKTAWTKVQRSWLARHRLGDPLAQHTSRTRESFHATFAATLGFPDFYGRNMNAWIDCQTYEDDGMTAFPIEAADVLTIQLQGCKEFRERCPEIYEALIDAAAFVNWRRIEMGERPILAISYH